MTTLNDTISSGLAGHYELAGIAGSRIGRASERRTVLGGSRFRSGTASGILSCT